MERKELAVKRFFKVMMPGFQHKLRLPPAMSKEVGKQKSRRATLQSRLGTWKISLCSNSENDYDLICFDQGWPQFVDRHALCIGDFLYFVHTGDLHFHVYVFDPTTCEKEYRDELMKEKEKEKEKEATEALNLTNHPKNSRREEAENSIPYFEKKMVPSSSTKWVKIHIPTEFMRSNNLGLRKSVTLRDPSGRAWRMKLAGDNRRTDGLRLQMYGEWRDFYESNGIKDEDICVFRLVRRLLTPTTLFFDVQIRRAP